MVAMIYVDLTLVGLRARAGRSFRAFLMGDHRVIMFFSLVLLLSKQYSLVFASCSASVTSFSSVSSQPKLIRTSYPSGSRQLCFKRNAFEIPAKSLEWNRTDQESVGRVRAM